MYDHRVKDTSEDDSVVPEGGQHPLYGQRIEIRASRWRQALRLIVAAAFTSLSWSLFREGRADNDVGAFLMVLPGVMAIWIGLRALVEFVRPGPRMVISPEGFFDRTLGVTLPWGTFFSLNFDFPFLPRMLEVHILDEPAWLPRVSWWKRTTYRLRDRMGGMGIVVGLGALRMPPAAIVDLIDAYESDGKVDRERHDRPARARERWLALPWHRRQREKWRVIAAWAWRERFRAPLLLFTLGAVLIALWGVVGLLLPLRELVPLEGRLMGWEQSRNGRLWLELETANGPQRIVSHHEGYDVERALGDARVGDRVVVRGRSNGFYFRFRELSVRGRVLVHAESSRRMERADQVRLVVLGIGMLAAIAGVVEYWWRWWMRQAELWGP